MDIISCPDVKKIKYIFLNTVHIYEQKHKNRTRVIVLNFLGSLIIWYSWKNIAYAILPQ